MTALDLSVFDVKEVIIEDIKKHIKENSFYYTIRLKIVSVDSVSGKECCSFITLFSNDNEKILFTFSPITNNKDLQNK